MSLIEIIDTDIGCFKIKSKNDRVYSAKFVDDCVVTKNNSLAVIKLKKYFLGIGKLNQKLTLIGTPFQIAVWLEIKKIPYGCTKTYGELATAIGKPKSYRAVANACGQNKVSLFIPCHRVVGKLNDGGYEWGISKKKWLLNLEKENI